MKWNKLWWTIFQTYMDDKSDDIVFFFFFFLELWVIILTEVESLVPMLRSNGEEHDLRKSILRRWKGVDKKCQMCHEKCHDVPRPNYAAIRLVSFLNGFVATVSHTWSVLMDYFIWDFLRNTLKNLNSTWLSQVRSSKEEEVSPLHHWLRCILRCILVIPWFGFSDQAAICTEKPSAALRKNAANRLLMWSAMWFTGSLEPRYDQIPWLLFHGFFLFARLFDLQLMHQNDAPNRSQPIFT